MSPRHHSDPGSVDRISRRTGSALIAAAIATTGALLAVNRLADASTELGWASGATIGLVAIGLVLQAGFKPWFFLFVGAASAFGAVVGAAAAGSSSDRATSAMVAAAITMTIGLCLDSILLSLHTVSTAEAAQWKANDEALRLAHLAHISADEALGLSRELHNQVANTLHAISRRFGASPEQIRQRCLTDLAHLAALRSLDNSKRNGGTAADLVAEARAHCTHLGLNLSATFGQPDEEIPQYDYVRATVVEALTNTSKHSAVTDAELFIVSRPDGLTVRVSDRGSGWRAGRGLGSGVTGAFTAAASAGPSVSISNQLAGGLLVTIEVPRPGQVDDAEYPTTSAALAVHTESTIPVARSLAFWLLGLAGALTVVLWEQFSPQWWAVVIILGTCMPMALINLGAARRAATNVRIFLVAGSLAVLVAMPIAGEPVFTGNQSLLLAGCIPASVSMLLTAWLWTPRQWFFTQIAMLIGLGAITWWAATASADQANIELYSALAALVAALTLVLCIGVRKLRRETSEHDESMLAALRQASRNIAQSESERSRARIRTRILDAIDNDVVTVLEEIANGGLDISEPAAISRVEQREADLRSVIAVASHPGELGEQLMPKIASARSKGVPLGIHGLTPEMAPESAITTLLANDLDLAIAASGPTSAMSIACYSTAESQGVFLQLTDIPDTGVVSDDTEPYRSVSNSPGFTVIEYHWATQLSED